MKRQLWFGLLIGALLTFVVHYTFVVHMGMPLSPTHGDMYQLYFVLAHYIRVAESGSWSQLFTLPMFSSEPYSLIFSEFFPIHGMVAMLLSTVIHNVVFIGNLFVLIGFWWSFVGMYAYCLYWTKRVAPSVLGGIVWACNAYILARFPDHVLLVNTGWIPLLFLAIERLLDTPSGNRWGLFWLVCIFQLTTSALYYAVFLTVMIPLYIGVRMWQRRMSIASCLHGFMKPRASSGFFAFLLVITLYVYLAIANPVWLSSSRRSSALIDVYSARLTDWLFAPPQNMWYGNWKKEAATRWPEWVRYGIYSEHNFFSGVGVWVLFIMSFFVVQKSKYRAIWLLFLFVLFFSMWMTLGNNGPFVWIRSIDPLFRFTRVPARFAVFAFFALSVIVSLTAHTVLAGRSRGAQRVMIVCMLLFLLGESWTKPLSFYRFSDDERAIYRALESNARIQQILEYPINNRIPINFPQARPEEADARYLLPASVLHTKTLFNGYNGFIPDEYFEKTGMISVGFPSKATLVRLARWGVDGILLHRSELVDQSQYNVLCEALVANGGERIMATPQISLFTIAPVQEDE